MKQKSLSGWLKVITVGMALIGAVLYFAVFPFLGNDAVQQYPEYSNWFYPWIIFLWLTAVPCYSVLILVWKIAGNIGKDNSFCKENAVMMKNISVLAAIDSSFFFAGNILYWLIGFNHPSILLASFFVVFIGVSFSVAAAVLSHLIYKAADMKEENDLTI